MEPSKSPQLLQREREEREKEREREKEKQDRQREREHTEMANKQAENVRDALQR